MSVQDAWIEEIERSLSHKEAALDNAADAVTNAVQEAHRAVEKETQRLNELLGLDPKMRVPVYVRVSPGPRVTVYHSTKNPCGHVHRGNKGSKNNFVKKFLGEVRHLQPCPNCRF